MKRRKHDFNKKSNPSSKNGYDLREDWNLIEASIAKQYGVRIRQQGDMPWGEFVTLVAGLMPDTPLGQTVSIRLETDPKAIKNFTPDQRRIYREWRTRTANNMTQQEYNAGMEKWAKTFAVMFGNKEVR